MRFSKTLSSVNQADAVADAILVRRLTNAGLGIVAPWLVVLALSGWEIPFLPQWWTFAAALVVTTCMLGFVAWTVFAGDRKTWRQAFEQANQSGPSHQ